MDNLHRELAPISDAAWSQIEEEATRTLKRNLAGRRVVDVSGPAGSALSAVGTGHLRDIETPHAGVLARQREVKPVNEFRVPFRVDRSAIDDVLRGAQDSDWQPVKDAAKKIAFAEDRAVFDGYQAAGIAGIRASSSNPALTLPAEGPLASLFTAVTYRMSELLSTNVWSMRASCGACDGSSTF